MNDDRYNKIKEYPRYAKWIINELINVKISFLYILFLYISVFWFLLFISSFSIYLFILLSSPHFNHSLFLLFFYGPILFLWHSFDSIQTIHNFKSKPVRSTRQSVKKLYLRKVRHVFAILNIDPMTQVM